MLVTLVQQSYQIEETKRDVEDGRRLRVMLDLFERRFRVYQATIDFIGNVMDLSHDNISQEEIVHFDVARNEASFLFAGDIDLLNYTSLAETMGESIRFRKFS